jgi:glycosyltransferase involved in cell wall biosynthesis
MLANRAYYFLKPVLPWNIRIAARRIRAFRRRVANRDVWPIDPASGVAPPGWSGWPEGRQFAVVLTHDVEGPKGLGRIADVMALEERLGFRSSFNLVPGEEYEVSDDLVRKISKAGFEVGVHGLEHDGKLYSSRAGFAKKASRINSFIRRWKGAGFRSPLMQHRLGWLHLLDAEYDSSTFDTDPFEPEPDGVRTIFPFWVPGPEGDGLVELPYTLAQDFTLFVVLREKNIDIWKRKLDWIAERGGMAMLITHPDYMAFNGEKPQRDEAPVELYEQFLTYIRNAYAGRFWAALPREVNQHYRAHMSCGIRNTRMRVCMLARNDDPADPRVSGYAEALAARGDLVDVIALQSTPGERPVQLRAVSVCGLQCQEKRKTFQWNSAWQLLRFYFQSTVFLIRRHRKIQYDIIHVHSILDFTVFAALYPRWQGAKVILHLRDTAPESFDEKPQSAANALYVKLLKLVARCAVRFADHVIISNQFSQKRLVERVVPAEKCSVLDNLLGPPADRRSTVCTLTFLSAGSFLPHGGADLAIRALARLKTLQPNSELHLNCDLDGPDSIGHLEKLASDLDVAGCVQFFGSGLCDLRTQLIANADIGVVLSSADAQGSEDYAGRIMEFMSYGVPVVASRPPSAKYSFSDECVCFVVAGNDEAIATTVLNVIRDPHLRDRLSRNGLNYANRRSWTFRKADYVSLIDSLYTERFPLVGTHALTPHGPTAQSRKCDKRVGCTSAHSR